MPPGHRHRRRRRPGAARREHGRGRRLRSWTRREGRSIQLDTGSIGSTGRRSGRSTARPPRSLGPAPTRCAARCRTGRSGSTLAHGQGQAHPRTASSITTADDAPIFVKNASRPSSTWRRAPLNTLTDGAASTRDGAIHCKTRLSIFGSGRLKVTGNVDDGINAEGGIIIEDGVYDVQSLESGIKSDINVIVNGGTYTINAGNDGLHGEQALDHQRRHDHRRTFGGGDRGRGDHDHRRHGPHRVVRRRDQRLVRRRERGPARGPRRAAGNGRRRNNTLVLQGGYVYVDANGDGLDINGPIE